MPICLDAAQSVGHLPVHLDDPSLDVDFVVFSGHKAMALPGSGAVWARNARGPVFRPDGWQGTPNTVGIVSLRAALDWLDATGVERIARWTTTLTTRLTDRLGRLGPYEVLGCPVSLAADSPCPRPSVATASSPSVTVTSRPTTSGSSSSATVSWCVPTASARQAPTSGTHPYG